MKRETQLIFIMRECCSSYTTALIIEDEKAETLRLAIIQFCIELRPRDGPFAVVRTDPSPGFQALANDLILKFHRISIELGRLKNGKNPVTERAVQADGNIYRELIPSQERYSLCCYRLVLQP